MKIPTKLKPAVCLTVDPSVPMWAMNILKHHGWKLVSEDEGEVELEDILLVEKTPMKNTTAKMKDELEEVDIFRAPPLCVSDFDMLAEG